MKLTYFANEHMFVKIGLWRVAIMPVCDKHLSLKLIMQDGDVVDRLPDWLNPSLAETIADEYRELIEKEYASENYLPAILFQIERLTWLQGVDDMADNLRRFVADVRKLAEDYAGIPAPAQDDYDLQQKYAEARRVTVRERRVGHRLCPVIAMMESYIARFVSLGRKVAGVWRPADVGMPLSEIGILRVCHYSFPVMLNLKPIVPIGCKMQSSRDNGFFFSIVPVSDSNRLLPVSLCIPVNRENCTAHKEPEAIGRGNLGKA